jgi:hypothetical protein
MMRRGQEVRKMGTENSDPKVSRSNIILGSGLSGMVAAYISARASEDNACQDDAWQAQQAFRPRIRAWWARHVGSHGGGTAVVS